MRLVLRIGGSVLVPAEIDELVLQMLVEQVSALQADHTLFVVVGGGKTARTYIEAARKFDICEEDLDRLGINSSKLNALLLATCLKDGELVDNMHEVLHARGVPVLGGTTPGQTTDTVAALLAEIVRANMLIKITNVDGIYTADPSTDFAAEKIPKMSFDQLETFSKRKFEAGLSSVIDPVAARIISESRLRTVVIGKEDMKDLKKVIKGQHSGTVIR